MIAVDIGGTRMRAAAFSAQGYEPIQIQRVPSQGAGASTQERLVQLIQSVCPSGEAIAAIGVAAPGPVDPQSGVIFTAPNLPALRNFPLVEYLHSKLHTPVFLDNDAGLAALGEWKAGAGQGHNDLIYLTISTGIGGGIICNGQLLHGARGMAAELGHVLVWPDGPVCGCGQRGHIEAIASGTHIACWVKNEIANGAASSLQNADEVSAKSIAEAARAGDDLSQRAYQRAGFYLGIALANFVHIFNPSMIIFGGGVSQSSDLLIEPAKESLAKHVIAPGYLDKLSLTTAALGDDAGIIGALILAREAIKKTS